MTGFIALEMRRSLRDIRYLVIAVAMPIGLYLLFTGLFGAHGQAPVPKAVLVLTAWLLGSSTAALLAYRRRNTRSAH